MQTSAMTGCAAIVALLEPIASFLSGGSKFLIKLFSLCGCAAMVVSRSQRDLCKSRDSLTVSRYEVWDTNRRLLWQGPFVSLMRALKASLFARFQRIFMTRSKKARCCLKCQSLCLRRRPRYCISDRRDVTVQAMQAELAHEKGPQNLLAEVKVIKASSFESDMAIGPCLVCGKERAQSSQNLPTATDKPDEFTTKSAEADSKDQSKEEGSTAGSRSVFRTCSICKLAVYCSDDCQRKHWDDGHRNECKETEPASDVHAERGLQMTHEEGQDSLSGSQHSVYSASSGRSTPSPQNQTKGWKFARQSFLERPTLLSNPQAMVDGPTSLSPNHNTPPSNSNGEKTRTLAPGFFQDVSSHPQSRQWGSFGASKDRPFVLTSNVAPLDALRRSPAENVVAGGVPVAQARRHLGMCTLQQNICKVFVRVSDLQCIQMCLNDS